MATQIQTDPTTHQDEQHQTTDATGDAPAARASGETTDPTESWTSRCGAPATFDPASRASIGQFDTTADQH